MAWTERQRAMLRAMGLSVWSPAAGFEAPPLGQEADESLVTEVPLVTEAAPVARGASTPVAPVAPVAPAPAAARPIIPVAAALAAGIADMREPLAGEVASLDWTGLRDAVAACRACALCESRKQTVFGVGHPNAQWMIVGEAPGEQEDLKGEPFVGPAGQLLDQMLRALGLSRSEGSAEQQVYIANTLKCRPPRNRNPEPAELARCEPFLRRQLALVQPKVILAMGRFAVQSLLQSDDAIGRLRGRVHHYEGVPLVVTYHPAYLLRQPSDKAKAWEDLCLAASLVQR